MIATMLLATATAFNPIILPPFTFAGRVTDYANCAYDSDQKVEIRAMREDGQLVAKTTTVTGGNNSYNFVLNIPMASGAIDGYAIIGTQLVFEFYDADGNLYDRLVTADDAKTGAPGELRELSIALATDSDGDGVPDEYVEWLGYLMWINGKERYEPDADWDGDGVKNRNEYIAGTNPFDPTDKFSIKEMATDKGYENYYKFSFLANNGRNYTVATTENLKDAPWKEVVFIDAEDGAKKSQIATSASQTAAYHTIYVLKENLKRQFWTLRVK